MLKLLKQHLYDNQNIIFWINILIGYKKDNNSSFKVA
jgi:hypothetical protein